MSNVHGEDSEIANTSADGHAALKRYLFNYVPMAKRARGTSLSHFSQCLSHF